MFKWKKSLVVLVVLALGVGSAHADFVDDFESGFAANWTNGGSTYIISTATNFAGNTGQSMKIDPTQGTATYTYSIPGTIPVTAGDEISFSLDYYASGVNGYFSILAKDAADGNVAVLWADALNVHGAWTNYDLETKYPSYFPLTIPAGATQLQFTNLGPNGEGLLYVDNITITTIPEPATMALLSIGSVGVLLRRRRK